jgi:hypothetical protein
VPIRGLSSPCGKGICERDFSMMLDIEVEMGDEEAISQSSKKVVFCVVVVYAGCIDLLVIRLLLELGSL